MQVSLTAGSLAAGSLAGDPAAAPLLTRIETRPGAVVWLVRHGETEWNAQRRLQGQHDSPLTPRGQRQALAIADLLARTLGKRPPVRLVSSPLGRTRATMAPIAAALDLPVDYDPRLMEIGLGAWEGMTWDEIEAAFPGALDGATSHERFFRPPGGETHAAMMARLGGWLAEVDGPTIAVSHGFSGRVLRGLYGGLDPLAALDQPQPQDGLFCLRDGDMEFLQAMLEDDLGN
ncbi:putative phosphoglycerate mutase [Stella humosa]|uniref:Putative phosphoglycerate mutase n=1 Tax=Stella humosa TaxID=94 RepID=A0A3N1M9D4_9PROT|nr:histidine phosphatase family protein [Stella humosa]ROQ00293.1 putative phosphoglycerate mutase [Stella humosa]BBK30469.1 phosphoglycerate mutase [Stella humosa]